MRRPVSVKTLSYSFISSFSKLSPFSQAASVATLPSALFVSAGAKIPIVPVEFSPPLDVVNRSHSIRRRFRDLLRGRDVQELKELQRQGVNIQAISDLTGWQPAEQTRRV